MTKKIYYLSSCSTCQRIMKTIGVDETWEQQDIKIKNISEKELSEIAKKAGGYDALFSKRAMKYKAMGLKDKNLSEEEIKQYILEEYTFLKRPIVLLDNEFFVGNAKKTVGAIQEALK